MKNIKSGNLVKLRALVDKKGINNIDFTMISGAQGVTVINDNSYNISEWGPLLLAIKSNSLAITTYLIEEIHLNPAIYLIKPRSAEEK